MQTIELRSDNCAGAAPEILAALSSANLGSALAYGGDAWTARLRTRVREVFEHADAEIFPVVSGTAANALGLSALCPPWGAVLCHRSAHVFTNECGATAAFSGGATVQPLPGDRYLIALETLRSALATARWGDPHQAQPSVLSLTCPSDYGTLCPPAQIAALAQVAKSRGLRVHLDGARLANALVALGCSPAELTWKAGVDVFTLGATKNGALSADAIVCFDPKISEQLVYRLKRAGHVGSKQRFLSAQLDAYLADGLWLRLAEHANAMMRRLTAGLDRVGVSLLARPEVNMAFARVNETESRRLAEAGLLFYDLEPGVIRLVTSFQTTPTEVDVALERFGRAVEKTAERR